MSTDAGRETKHADDAAPGSTHARAADVDADPRPHRPSRRRRILLTLLLGAVAFGFVYFVLPQVVGLGPTLERLGSGNPWWLGLGIPLEAISLAAYVGLFHGVFCHRERRIGWRASWQITLAGGGASKLFAAAGSGGIALTIWALRASGVGAAEVAESMVCFEILNYGVYMLALVVAGFGLWLGLFPGAAPVGLTLIPALVATGVIAVVLLMHWLADPAERFLVERERRARGRAAGWWHRASAVPRSLQGGLDSAIEMVRSRDRSWLYAVPAWGFEIGVLWASFRAFGDSPPAAVLVMGFFVGTLGNTIPLPGGIGGVEGGMIGAFIGFGVSGSLAVVAVLAYRVISYWAPLLPEMVAYLRLRRTVADWRADGAASGRSAA